MLSDAHQLGYSVREYTVVGRIIDDVLKKIVNLISVISSSFGIDKRLSEKKIPGSGSSYRRFVDLADR
jgi:hypothetical protein